MRRRYHARLLCHAVFCTPLAYSAIVLRAQSNSALSPPFTLDLRVSPNPEAPVLSWVGSMFSDIFTLDLRVETLGGVASAWSDAFSVDLVVGAFVRLVQPQVLAGGGFQFTVVGDVIGTLQAESSDDLLTWKAMSTPPIHALPATVSDASPSPTNHRYYRVIAIP